MNLWKIREFRLGCSKEGALLHLSEEQLQLAVREKKVQLIEGMYYALPVRGDKASTYLTKQERPLEYNPGCRWALSTCQS